MFALRFKDTKEFVGFTSRGNDTEFSVDVEFVLNRSSYTGNVWVTQLRSDAENAAVSSSDWYNACFETPTNPYVGQLEVVELTAV